MSDLGDFRAANFPDFRYRGLSSEDNGLSLDPEPQSLETLVALDMRTNGVNPKNPAEVQTYWKTSLEPRRLARQDNEPQPDFIMFAPNEGPVAPTAGYAETNWETGRLTTDRDGMQF